jgi:hypothetical protein
MDGQEEKFESYLRGFKPRRPRALPFLGTAAPVWVRRLAAACIVAIAILASIWFQSRRPGATGVEVVSRKQNDPSAVECKANTLSLISLTRLALEDSARLDETLTSSSPSVLPDVRRNDRALRLLVEE